MASIEWFKCSITREESPKNSECQDKVVELMEIPEMANKEHSQWKNTADVEGFCWPGEVNRDLNLQMEGGNGKSALNMKR